MNEISKIIVEIMYVLNERQISTINERGLLKVEKYNVDGKNYIRIEVNEKYKDASK